MPFLFNIAFLLEALPLLSFYLVIPFLSPFKLELQSFLLPPLSSFSVHPGSQVLLLTFLSLKFFSFPAILNFSLDSTFILELAFRFFFSTL